MADKKDKKDVGEEKKPKGDSLPGVEDEEDEEEGKEKDKPEGDVTPEPEESGSQASDSDVQDLVNALQEHGINLDPEAVTTPKELMRHLTIALKALKGVLQPVGGGAAKVEEQPSASLSRDEKSAYESQVLGLKTKLAQSRLQDRVNRINELVANGQASPAKGKAWVKTLTEDQLGLADDELGDKIRDVVTQIEYAEKEVPPGTLFSEAAKKLSSRAADAKLSTDVLEPMGEQVFGCGSIDPERMKQVAKEFCKATGIEYKE